MNSRKIVRSSVFFIALVCALFVTSCSTKKIVYIQGADSMYAYPKQIEQAFELQVQPDDELAIAVNSKTKELIEPFNTRTIIGTGTNNDRTSYSTTTSNVSITYFLVDKEGGFDFPVLGRIHAKGKNCREISQIIQDRLRNEGHILDAEVTTKIMSFKVTVLGDVRNPGVQTHTGERLTVLEAIGKAGDMNGTAKREDVLVVREENGVRVTYNINVRDAQSVFESPAYYLQQNDVVYVQPNKSVRLKNSTGYALWSFAASIASMAMTIVTFVLALKD